MRSTISSSPNSVGLLCHNIGGGFDDDMHLDAILDRFKNGPWPQGIRPRIHLFTEAYELQDDDTRIASVAEDIERLGSNFLVAYGSYERDGVEGGHGLLIAFHRDCALPIHPEESGAARYVGMERFAGRGLVELALRPEENKPAIVTVGGHLSTYASERAEETSALLRVFREATALGHPMIVYGDLNSSGSRDALSYTFRALGVVAQLGIRLRLLREAGLDETHARAIPRIVSLMTRAGANANGKELEAFLEAGFVDADQSQLPTAFVPELPEQFEAFVRLTGPIGRWMLNEPHLALDHILGSPGVQTQNYTQYPALPGDNHLAISADISYA